MNFKDTKLVLKNASIITIPIYLFNLMSLNVHPFKHIELNQKLMYGEPNKHSSSLVVILVSIVAILSIKLGMIFRNENKKTGES